MSFELKQMAWPGWFSREHFDIMEKYVHLWCAQSHFVWLKQKNQVTLYGYFLHK
jgi:hypothetical protein